MSKTISDAARRLWEDLHCVVGNEDAWEIIQRTLDEQKKDYTGQPVGNAETIDRPVSDPLQVTGDAFDQPIGLTSVVRRR